MTPDNENIIKDITASGLKPPEMLTLMITRGCNLFCTHCLLECISADHASPVSKDNIERIIEDFHGLGGRDILLTGGEPLTHPDWKEILEFACLQPGFREVGLQTNAVLMDEEIIEHIISLPLEKLVLQISLDGARPETNDLIRGKGSFDATVKALNRLKEKGLADNIRIAFTEMRHNYDELPDIVNLVERLRLKGLVSGTLVKIGRSLKTDGIALPTRSQVRALIEKYKKDSSFRKIYERKGNISAIEWFKGRDTASSDVCNCIKTPFINAAGKMYPCVMYLNDDLSVDNVHERGLRETIYKGLPKWSSLPEISAQRSTALEKCKDCPGRAHCGGGCVGRAEAVNGTPMSVEDRCGMRREVYFYQEQ